MISSLDLARLCKVSQGTVDRALHDRPGISPRTRARILEMARRHGYLPHPGARELMGAGSKQVAAVIPASRSVFFMDLLEEVRRQLRLSGLRLLLQPVSGKEEFRDAVMDAAARRLAGLVVIPPVEGITLPRAVTTSMPVASLLSPCRGQNVVFVAPDEETTGCTAVDYLAGLGHERILHLSYTRRARAVRDRARGYRRRMRELGLRPAVMAPLRPEQLARRVGSGRVTAIFCHNDWLALRAMRVLDAAGLRVPASSSILGVDHSPSFTELCPGLASMQYPYVDIAAAVTAALRGDDRLPPVGDLPVVEGRSVARP